jgi:hypothetical protein
MVSALIISQKGNARRRYIVRAEDWLNPEIYLIDAQIPYLGDTDVIQKSEYEISGFLDESGDEGFFFKGGER